VGAVGVEGQAAGLRAVAVDLHRIHRRHPRVVQRIPDAQRRQQRWAV
jgi:hypothetical protein